jgi:integrase
VLPWCWEEADERRGKNKHEEPIYKSDLKFHHLRHTCLSWLGDTGANDMVIKAIAGHADEDVTDRYVHVSLDAMREAIEKLEQAKLHRDDGENPAGQQEREVG